MCQGSPADEDEQQSMLKLKQDACTTLPLTAQEIDWLTDEVLRIYVVARDTHEERLQILTEALQWRIEKRELLSKLVCATCARDPLSHDARVFGVDPEGDIVFSNCFALPHDTTAEYITDHMVCLFERSLRMFPASPGGPRRRWSWVVDLYGFGSSLRHMDPRTSVALLHLLQTAYRARLKRILIIDAPTAFWALWKVVEPFIKPATAALIEFVNWPEAPARYLAAFGDEVATELIREGAENRDERFRATKTWTTFYGDAVVPATAKAHKPPPSAVAVAHRPTTESPSGMRQKDGVWVDAEGDAMMTATTLKL